MGIFLAQYVNCCDQTEDITAKVLLGTCSFYGFANLNKDFIKDKKIQLFFAEQVTEIKKSLLRLRPL